MDTNEMLHILRNPFGHSEDDVRTARLKAADHVEKFMRERAQLQHKIDGLIENADV